MSIRGAALSCALLFHLSSVTPAWSQEAGALRGLAPVQRLAATQKVPYPGLALTPDFHLRIEFAPRAVAVS